MQQTFKTMDSFLQNITQKLPFGNTGRFQPAREGQVYLQLESSTENIPARIVHVKPEFDIAILHLNSTSLKETNFQIPPPIPDGLASDLLVGQTVLAIGNPFGLSQTVTTGVISALDRSVKGIAGNDIKRCIQTDAAINPGNSGGPLLNSRGEVVGVNTMIISTSGSSAGIGFAVPVDGFWGEVMDVIEDDRIEERLKRSEGGGRKRGWLGLKIVLDESLKDALFKRMGMEKKEGLFVMKVDEDSPALDAGVVPLDMKDGKVNIGDRIIAVNGNMIEDSKDLKREIKDRVVGEKVTLTVEDAKGERRVVYITLKEKP
jgi:S1-C subfamily serine protease